MAHKNIPKMTIEQIKNKITLLKNIQLFQLVEELNKPEVPEDAFLRTFCEEVFEEDFRVEAIIQLSFFLLNEIKERFQLEVALNEQVL